MDSRERWERWQRAGDVLNLLLFLALVVAIAIAVLRFDQRTADLANARQTPMAVVVVTPAR